MTVSVLFFIIKMGTMPKTETKRAGGNLSYSILDVAQKANVSKSTVSRVLTGGSVSEKAERAVRQAIEELDYYPNHMAQGLRGMPSHVIGIACPTVNALLNRSTTTRLAGMNDIFFRQGYSMMLMNLDVSTGKNPVNQALRYLSEGRVDGLIFLSDVDDESERRQISGYREIVYTGERIDERVGFRVYMGNYSYSRDLYYYLMGNGHRRILTVCQQGSNRMKLRRINAYKEVCETFHVPDVPDSLLDFSDINPENKAYMEHLYQTFLTGNYTAIYADTIELGNSIVNFFTTKGLKLKHDYSIVTIERGTTEKTKDSLITSVCLPDFEYGRQCAELILKVIRIKEMEYEDIRIPYTLEIRRSVKNILE